MKKILLQYGVQVKFFHILYWQSLYFVRFIWGLRYLHLQQIQSWAEASSDLSCLLFAAMIEGGKRGIGWCTPRSACEWILWSVLLCGKINIHLQSHASAIPFALYLEWSKKRAVTRNCVKRETSALPPLSFHAWLPSRWSSVVNLRHFSRHRMKERVVVTPDRVRWKGNRQLF